VTTSLLPPPPDFRRAVRAARRTHAALETLHRCGARTFAQLFGSRQGGAAPTGQAQTSAIDTLLQVGLLKRSPDGGLYSDYLITPWEEAFYVTDFPEGRRDEVFAPFPETRFFSTLLQARPGDTVLDLGTGSGILLLEAARRGATGLGIDCSERALAFARANAVLNGLEAQVRFEPGDLTQPGDAWGKPTLVLSNPPFEPVPDVPGALPLPVHSDGGPYGDAVVTKMLAALAQWSHRPALIQLVLFSLGKTSTDEFLGDHIHLKGILAQTGHSLGAMVELHELAKPIRLKDFLILTSKDGLAVVQQQLSWLEAKGFQTLHWLFATLYLPKPPVPTWAQPVRWVPYDKHCHNDECFLWALASPKRRPATLDVRDEADIAARHLLALIEAREEMMAGQPVDLFLSDDAIRRYMETLLRDDTLLNGARRLLLVDLRRTPAGGPSIGGVVIVTAEDTKFEKYSFGQLQALTEEQLGTRVGAVRCDVGAWGARRVDASETKYLKWDIAVGTLSEVLLDQTDGSERGELPAGVIQRFVLLSAPEECLSPVRQRFFANLLSELAGNAHTVKLRRAFASYSVAHPLKHRLGQLHADFGDLWDAYEALAPMKQLPSFEGLTPYGENDEDPAQTLPRQIQICKQLIDKIYAFAELSHLLHFALVGDAEQALAARSAREFRFVTTSEFNLTDEIDSVVREINSVVRLFDPKSPATAKPLTFSQPVEFKAVITPFARVGENSTVRLQDIIYREVLYEIFSNVAEHGLADEAGSVPVTIRAIFIESAPAIEVSNAAKPAALENLRRSPGAPLNDPNEWTEWERLSPSGLTFVANTLRATGAGRLLYRYSLQRESAASLFSVAVIFRGLTLLPEPSNGG